MTKEGSPFKSSDSDSIAERSETETDEIESQKPFLVDGHVDLPYFMMKHANAASLGALADGPFTLDRAKQAGVRLFCTALYCEDSYNGARSFQHFQDVLHFTNEHFDQVTIIKNRHDLKGLQESPEGLGTLFLLENADALTGNVSYISKIKEVGIGIVGLTHVGNNRLGDGNAVFHSDGLTPDGREVVRVLTDHGLLIDVAHLHPKCFWQLLDMTEAPIISSHTGIRKICDIQRNIDLTQAREVFERGGTVGITFNPEMLSPEGIARTEDVFAHLDTLVQRFGPNGVGIGSDYCGFELVTEGLEDITGITSLMEMMQTQGYDDNAIAKIMGFNWLRVYESFL
jgi:membrane dipeptidase